MENQKLNFVGNGEIKFIINEDGSLFIKGGIKEICGFEMVEKFSEFSLNFSGEVMLNFFKSKVSAPVSESEPIVEEVTEDEECDITIDESRKINEREWDDEEWEKYYSYYDITIDESLEIDEREIEEMKESLNELDKMIVSKVPPHSLFDDIKDVITMEDVLPKKRVYILSKPVEILEYECFYTSENFYKKTYDIDEDDSDDESDEDESDEDESDEVEDAPCWLDESSEDEEVEDGPCWLDESDTEEEVKEICKNNKILKINIDESNEEAQLIEMNDDSEIFENDESDVETDEVINISPSEDIKKKIENYLNIWDKSYKEYIICETKINNKKKNVTLEEKFKFRGIQDKIQRELNLEFNKIKKDVGEEKLKTPNLKIFYEDQKLKKDFEEKKKLVL